MLIDYIRTESNLFLQKVAVALKPKLTAVDLFAGCGGIQPRSDAGQVSGGRVESMAEAEKLDLFEVAS